MPKVTCIVVTYMSEETIEECVASLFDAMADNQLEVIVIENASGDNTVRIVSEFSDKYPALRIIENRNNLGFARAVNQGIAAGEGDYFLILNPDTVLHQGAVNRLLDFLQNNPEYGIAAPKHIRTDGTVLRSCREFPTHLSLFWHMTGLAAVFPGSKYFNSWKMGYFDHEESRDVDQPMGACLLASREDVESVGYMDEQFEMFFNDVDWCRRFLEKGRKIRFLSDSVITHHGGHSIRKKRLRMIFSSHCAFYRYFSKYYSGFKWIIPNIVIGFLLGLSAAFRIIKHAVFR